MSSWFPRLSALAVLLAAAPAAQAADSCFRLSDLGNHSVVDDHTLLVRKGMHGVIRMTMSGACLAGKSSSDPLIVEPAGGAARLCRPIDLNLKVGGAGGPSPCIVKSFETLTPAEIAAIPARQRP